MDTPPLCHRSWSVAMPLVCGRHAGKHAADTRQGEIRAEPLADGPLSARLALRIADNARFSPYFRSGRTGFAHSVALLGRIERIESRGAWRRVLRDWIRSFGATMGLDLLIPWGAVGCGTGSAHAVALLGWIERIESRGAWRRVLRDWICSFRATMGLDLLSLRGVGAVAGLDSLILWRCWDGLSGLSPGERGGGCCGTGSAHSVRRWDWICSVCGVWARSRDWICSFHGVRWCARLDPAHAMRVRVAVGLDLLIPRRWRCSDDAAVVR